MRVGGVGEAGEGDVGAKRLGCWCCCCCWGSEVDGKVVLKVRAGEEAMLTKLGDWECVSGIGTDTGLWCRCGCSVWTAKAGNEIGEVCAFSSWPVGFCGWPARVGEVIAHGGVAMFELRGPSGDGRAGV